MQRQAGLLDARLGLSDKPLLPTKVCCCCVCAALRFTGEAMEDDDFAYPDEDEDDDDGEGGQGRAGDVAEGACFGGWGVKGFWGIKGFIGRGVFCQAGRGQAGSATCSLQS